MERSGTSLAMGIGLLIAAAVIVDSVFTRRKPWDIVLAVARGDTLPKADTSSHAPVAPSGMAAGVAPNANGGTTPSPVSLVGSLKAAAAVTFAMSAIGTPYSVPRRWAGIGPNGGVDCSSLIALAARAAGVNVGSTSYEQATNGANVPLDPHYVRPGDLIFYYGDSPRRNLGHVAMAISSTEQIAAPHTGTVVQRQPIRWEGAGPNSTTGVQMIRRVF